MYEDINGNKKYNYQYTYAHKEYVTYHYSGKLMPALWFRYELQPITIKYTERRQPFYTFITSVCFCFFLFNDIALRKLISGYKTYLLMTQIFFEGNLNVLQQRLYHHFHILLDKALKYNSIFEIDF